MPSFYSLLLDFLFPKRSLTGKEGDWITEAELRDLLTIPCRFESAELQKRGLLALDAVTAMGAYRQNPRLRQAIHALKYRRIHGVGLVLQELFHSLLSKHVSFDPEGVICPIPLHVFRKFQRGFNQAEVLSVALSSATGLPVRLLLHRRRPTGHQAHRNREERLHALRGAFALTRWHQNVPATVYLIDDVFTTGSTLEECAKVLKAAGVRRVEGLVLAYD